MAKRCLSSEERCGWCPTPFPKCSNSLQNSLSPSSFLPHYLLYDSITVILSAKPLHHTDSSFGHRVRGNLFDFSQKIIDSQFFLPNSHPTLGPDLLVIHKPLIIHSSMISCSTLHQFHSAHPTPAPISTRMCKTWPLWHLSVPDSSHSHLCCFYLFPFPSPSDCLAPSDSGPYLCRLEKSVHSPRFIFPVLYVFSGRLHRENFLTMAMGPIQSKIPSDSPLGVSYITS
jgi:hypothetical protein